MSSTLQEADLQTFLALDYPTKVLILRLLDNPTDADFAELGIHPDAFSLASWLLELPPYRRAADTSDATAVTR